MTDFIFLDNNSTTPLDPEVLEVLIKTSRDTYGNSSSPHAAGWKARQIIEKAREEVASLIDCESGAVIFSSGATESNNLVLQGVVARLNESRKAGEAPPIAVCSRIEHSSVLRVLEALNNRNLIRLEYLEVDPQGQISTQENRKKISSLSTGCEPALLSIQLANSEIGSIQDISRIMRDLDTRSIFLHSDITQALGKIAFSLKNSDIDVVSFSAHKFHGPKGIGAFAAKDLRTLDLLTPVVYGGAQEKGIRSGTLPTPQIAALGEAARLARLRLNERSSRLSKLAECLYRKISDSIPNIKLIGPTMNARLPGNLSIAIPGLKGEALVAALSATIGISTGSACLSQDGKASHVPLALGISEGDALSIVRIGIGAMNTESEIDFAANKIVDRILNLKGQA